MSYMNNPLSLSDQTTSGRTMTVASVADVYRVAQLK